MGMFAQCEISSERHRLLELVAPAVVETNDDCREEFLTLAGDYLARL